MYGVGSQRAARRSGASGSDTQESLSLGAARRHPQRFHPLGRNVLTSGRSPASRFGTYQDSRDTGGPVSTFGLSQGRRNGEATPGAASLKHVNLLGMNPERQAGLPHTADTARRVSTGRRALLHLLCAGRNAVEVGRFDVRRHDFRRVGHRHQVDLARPSRPIHPSNTPRHVYPNAAMEIFVNLALGGTHRRPADSRLGLYSASGKQNDSGPRT